MSDTIVITVAKNKIRETDATVFTRPTYKKVFFMVLVWSTFKSVVYMVVQYSFLCRPKAYLSSLGDEKRML